MITISIFNEESKVNQPLVGFCFTKMLIVLTAIQCAFDVCFDLINLSLLISKLVKIAFCYNLKYDQLEHNSICIAASSESAARAYKVGANGK